MTEDKLRFCLLCGSLEDAIELMDAGKLETAKALLERMLEQAHRFLEEEETI